VLKGRAWKSKSDRVLQTVHHAETRFTFEMRIDARDAVLGRTCARQFWHSA
jgi:hypothetical protein